MHGYCTSCKKKVEIMGGKTIKMSNGRFRMEGLDNKRHKVSRFLPSPK